MLPMLPTTPMPFFVRVKPRGHLACWINLAFVRRIEIERVSRKEPVLTLHMFDGGEFTLEGEAEMEPIVRILGPEAQADLDAVRKP